MKNICLSLLFFLVLLSHDTLKADDSFMLVLDVSGSMWGQIEGKTKIEIAREAVISLIDSSPDTRQIGIVAYGHRRKGDCADIETVLPLGSLDRKRLAKVVESLTPRGMTPLSASVKHAAEALKYTEQKATVVLVSDGIENCNLDPCEIGKELEALGVDFTAHVIGFDVSGMDQTGLRCLAESTGGVYLTAENSEQLADALSRTVKVEPTPEPTLEPTPAPTPEPTPEPTPLPEVRLIAPDSAIKGTSISIDFDAPAGMEGYVHIHKKGNEKDAGYIVVREGTTADYAKSELRLPGQTGEFELIWKAKDGKELTRHPLTLLEAEVEIRVPEKVIKGTAVDVAITAPDGLDGYVYLYASGKDTSITYTNVRENPAGGYVSPSLRMPAATGIYDIRWLSSKNDVLAETSLEVIDTSISIKTVDSSPIGTEISIEIDAPEGLDGYLYLYMEGKDNHLTYALVREAKTGGYQNGKLRLPAVPGKYVIKWLSGKRELLAETMVEAVGSDISIRTVEEAPTGSEVSVEIEAPEGLDGYLYLYADGRENHLTYTLVRESNTGGYQKGTLRLPATPGKYVVKWLSGKRELLAETGLQAIESQISLTHENEVIIGSELDISIDAPEGLKGYIYLYPSGKDKHVSYELIRPDTIKSYRPVTVRMPSTPGTYDLKWINSYKEVLVSSQVMVNSVDATLTAPAEVSPGEKFEVQIDAPAGINGYLNVYPKGETKRSTYVIVRDGRIGNYAPASIKAPEKAGEYDIKWERDDNVVLSETTFSVLSPAETNMNAAEENAE